MIFAICLIVAVVFIVLSVLFDRNNCDVASLISGIISAPAVVATIIMLIVLILPMLIVHEQKQSGKNSMLL